MSALLDALTRGITNYLGGRKTLLTRLCVDKSDEVFRKELQGSAHHKLGAVDALAAAVACCQAQTPHCYDYAAHVAEECGGRFVIEGVESEACKGPIQRIKAITRETGDVAEVVIDAMADGIVTDNELFAIETEISEAEEALRKMRQAARAVNAAGKPRSMVTLPVRSMRNEVPA